jgi:hypothetical protein
VSVAYEKDYILRIARQLALFAARLLRLKEEGELEKAEQAILAAYGELFGIDRRFVPMMRPEHIVQSLGPERAQLFVGLIAEEAELRAMRGDAHTAALVAQQGLSILDAADSADERLRLRLVETARGGIVG